MCGSLFVLCLFVKKHTPQEDFLLAFSFSRLNVRRQLHSILFYMKADFSFTRLLFVLFVIVEMRSTRSVVNLVQRRGMATEKQCMNIIHYLIIYYLFEYLV